MKKEQKYCVIQKEIGLDPDRDIRGVTLSEAIHIALSCGGRDYVIYETSAWWYLGKGYIGENCNEPIYSFAKTKKKAYADIVKQCYSFSKKHVGINGMIIVTEKEYEELLRSKGYYPR